MVTEHARKAQWQGSLLPHMVDRLAVDTPDATHGLWPVAPASYGTGFRTINYAQLSNIVNGLAWWLMEQLGPPSHPDQVLTYIGPDDVRLTALVLAATKTGYVLFLTSPRSGVVAHQALFNTLQCRTIVTVEPSPPTVEATLEAVKPREITAPSVDELLDQSYPTYAYNETFEQVRWDPVMIFHTSGSTGIPKPVIWSQESAARHFRATASDLPGGTSLIEQAFHGKRVLVTVPPFHGAGLTHYVLNAIQFGDIAIAPAAVGIATSHGVVDEPRRTPADVAVLVPSVVSELAQNPQLLDSCATHLPLILYFDGYPPQVIGVRLRCLWGSSETGIPIHLMPAGLNGPGDGPYVLFHPCTEAVFEKVADGKFELVIQRDQALTDTQLALSVQGQEHLKEYRTRDLFEPHPKVPGAWCRRSRADDVIVLSNGEKTPPASMEHHVVTETPELSGAIVVGAQRFQAALLIEPATAARYMTTNEQATLIERVCHSVGEANRATPAHARVEKSLIMVTARDRPLLDAGKGTIQRLASLDQYAKDIDRLYTNAGVLLDDDDTEDMLLGEYIDAVNQLGRECVSSTASWIGVDGSANFFERRMDSFQAHPLTRSLGYVARRAGIDLPMV